MKINKHLLLIIGLLITIASAYYWAAIGKARPLAEVPLVFQYTYRLYPYVDVVITAAGMLAFYRGLMKLRK